MITNRLYIILGLCCLWLALPFCCMKVEAQNFVVVIDPGHGGSDPGSIGYKTKVREADLNLTLSLMLKDKLESAGINVIMTRKDNNALIEGSGKKWKKDDVEIVRPMFEEVGKMLSGLKSSFGKNLVGRL